MQGLGMFILWLGRVAALASAVLAGLTVMAHAHASLVSTSPQDGSTIPDAPSILSLTFSEPVSPLTLSLIAPDGERQALDTYVLRDRTLEITPPAGMAQGTHVLSWRITSEDGHPVGGAVVFSVGAASAAPATAVEEIDWTIRSGLWASRVLFYVGLFIGVGGAFAAIWLLRGEMQARGVIAGALALGAAAAVASIGFQGLDALGVPVWAFADPRVWSIAMTTSFGRTVVVALLAILLAALSLRGATAATRSASLVALVLVGVSLSLSGHASAAEPQWLTRPSVFLHGSTIAFWAGALIPLGMALHRGTPEASAGLRRFSAVIPYVVAGLIAAGIALAVVQVERPAALVETAYGRVLLLKLGLLVILFALAAVNRWRLTAPAERGDRATAIRLARSIAVEIVVVLAILGVAAAWRFTPPPRALAAAAAVPASFHAHTAKAMADGTITPGRAGVVDVSVVLMTGDFGPLDAKELTLVFANPEAGIEPIRRPAVKPGDGSWRIEGLVLPVAGTWTVRLDILISDFEMDRLTSEVTIRP